MHADILLHDLNFARDWLSDLGHCIFGRRVFRLTEKLHLGRATVVGVNHESDFARKFV